MSSLPSVIFHKYEVEKQICTGAFGEVFKAVTKNNKEKENEPVTIRTFRENHKAMEDLDQSEIDVVSQLQHENIVR